MNKTSRPLKAACLCLGLIAAGGMLQGCKTVSALVDGDSDEHIYQEFETETILAKYEDVRVPPLKGDFFVSLVDKIKVKDQNSLQYLNFTAEIKRYEKRKSDYSLGLASPIEDYKKEAKLSKEQVFESRGSAEVQAYIDSLINKILAVWPNEKPAIEFSTILVNDDTFLMRISKFGVIKIPIRTLKEVQSEDELVAILAHEMSHAFLNHHDAEQRRLYENKRNTIVTAIILSQLLKEDAPLDGNEETAGVLFKLQQLNNEYQAGDGFHEWRREQEIHADLMAIEILSLAGYKKDAVKDFLTTLRSFESRRQAAETSEFALQTDEQPDKINLWAELGKALKEADEQIATAITDDEDSEDARHYTKLSGDEDHPTAEEREFNVSEYFNRHHTEFQAFEKTIAPLKKALYTGEGRYVIANFILMDDAKNDLKNGNPAAAIEKINKVLKSPRDPNAQARMIMYRARKAQGNQSLAIKNLEIALNSSYASRETYNNLVDEYMAINHHTKAIRTWQTLIQQDEKLKAMQDQEKFGRLVELQTRAKRYKDAQRTINTCAQRGGRPLAHYCHQVFTQHHPEHKDQDKDGKKPVVSLKSAS